MAHIEQDSSMSDVVIFSNIQVCLNMPMQDVTIIDIDTFEYEDILEQAKTSVRVCDRYTMDFLEEKSSHTVYPFALHDTFILPWDYALKNGVMKLFACSCHGLSEGSGTACQPCQGLAKNKKLENILRRMEEGIHENAGFAYHGIAGLQQMLHCKNQEIELRRLTIEQTMHQAIRTSDPTRLFHQLSHLLASQWLSRLRQTSRQPLMEY